VPYRNSGTRIPGGLEHLVSLVIGYRLVEIAERRCSEAEFGKGQPAIA
jgi:hypothetical protein